MEIVDLAAAANGGDALTPATRQRVLLAVVQDGPVTTGDLAAAIGLTQAAVRRHLDALTAEGRVTSSESVRTGVRGRPARAFSATELGRDAVARHRGASASPGDDLAAQALRHLAASLGRPAVAAVARERALALTARYQERVDDVGPDLRHRVGALAAALSGDGYAATSRAVLPSRARSGRTSGASAAPSAVQLCQGSCPVQHLAAEFPELCEAETEAFGELLGTHVRRLATLAHGEHVCTTHVPLFSAPAVAPRAPGASTAPRTPAPQTPTGPSRASTATTPAQLPPAAAGTTGTPRRATSPATIHPPQEGTSTP